MTPEKFIYYLQRAFSRNEGSKLIGHIADGDDAEATTVQAKLDELDTHIADNSIHNRHIMIHPLVATASALGTGDGALFIPIPAQLAGWNLIDADVMVNTVSSSGTPTYQIYNLAKSHDILSTRVTIDVNERTSYTAAAASVIDTGYDDVAIGDIYRIDKDVAGTGEKGDTIILVFQAP